MESKLGDVKPLINEQPTDTSKDYEKYRQFLSGNTSGQAVNNTQSMYDQYLKLFTVTPGQTKSNITPVESFIVKEFQDYMDTIGPWVKTKTGQYVKLNKGKGYGTIGPNTFAAWKKYGKQYLGKKVTTQTTTTNPNNY